MTSRLRQISLQAHPDALGRECAHHCKEQAGSIQGIQPINFFHAELASKENPILRDLFDEIPDYVHGRTLTMPKLWVGQMFSQTIARCPTAGVA